MISVYSSYAARAIQVTDYIHRRHPGRKVFWGGPHCISVPEAGCAHADGICFSEGDEAVVDLADRLEKGERLDLHAQLLLPRGRQDRHATGSCLPSATWTAFPYYDYELDGQFMLDRQLIPMTRRPAEGAHGQLPLPHRPSSIS